MPIANVFTRFGVSVEESELDTLSLSQQKRPPFGEAAEA